MKELIVDICSVHDSYSRDFIGAVQGEMLNLKKKRIDSIITNDQDEEQQNFHLFDPSFLDLIQNYQDALGKQVVYMDYDFDYRHFDFRLRIKQKDSIINKLFHYRYAKAEQGGVSINKCLNDLLGFRIMIDDFDHASTDVDDFLDDIKSSIGYKLNCNNACKDDYKATHIYINGDNKYFPWELQIWNPIDAERNEQSHKEHKSKREYIKWPQEYKEGH
ncbi:hypothetical protein Q0V21_25000 [Paenibacillus sp. 11B]|nr:hypothetical protein [Paenibacillus sp. 11B]